jgi:peroxiredoxin family protein
MAINASKGILDMAYKPFVQASTAAVFGYVVQVSFVFYGAKRFANSSISDTPALMVRDSSF